MGQGASGMGEGTGNVQGICSFWAYGNTCKLQAYSGCRAVCCVCACSAGRDMGTHVWTRAWGEMVGKVGEGG